MTASKTLLASLLAATLLATGASAAEAPEPPARDWHFQGPFGTFDRAALQRGFQVYKEVCSACHSMNHLHYRDLTALGYTEDEVKAIAASVEVEDGPNDQGEMFTRPGRPYDAFKAPFPNEEAARAANNGALPPDLSVIVKTHPNGEDYVHALLTGYQEPPPGAELPQGMFYNTAAPNHQIAMPPPLSEGGVAYQDGTQATVPQMAEDVVTFLAWAAEPSMEDRKRLGFKVMLFLVVLSGVLYGAKRRIWSRVH